jgi:hypothetical protein
MPRGFSVVGSSLVHAVIVVGAEGLVELGLDRGVLRAQHQRRRVALAAQQPKLSRTFLGDLNNHKCKMSKI